MPFNTASPTKYVLKFHCIVRLKLRKKNGENKNEIRKKFLLLYNKLQLLTRVKQSILGSESFGFSVIMTDTKVTFCFIFLPHSANQVE